MKECCTESALALYVESDLPDREMERIRLHVEECSACRAVVSELCETQFELKAFRQVVAPASAHASVREHVMEQITDKSPFGWSMRLERMLCGLRWRYAVCCVAALGIVGATLWQFHRVEQPGSAALVRSSSPSTEVSQPEKTAVDAPPIPTPARLVRKRRNQRTPSSEMPVAGLQPPVVDERKADSPRPVMVKLITDDPSVTIYWIVDQNGGSE